MEPHRADQPPECIADGRIVIDNEHDSLRPSHGVLSAFGKNEFYKVPVRRPGNTLQTPIDTRYMVSLSRFGSSNTRK